MVTVCAISVLKYLSSYVFLQVSPKLAALSAHQDEMPATAAALEIVLPSAEFSASFLSSSFGADLLSSFSTDAANFAGDLTYSKSRLKGALGTAAENSTNITTPQKISDDINYISAGYNFAAASTNDGKVIL